jgi:uncharacterized protein (TIGR03437 family)
LDSAQTSVTVGGQTYASNSPVTGSAYQTTNAGSGDAYIARFDLGMATAAPQITLVENGASLSQDSLHALSPGMIVTLKGTGLGPNPAQGGAIDGATGRVSTNVAGVQVLIANTPCPLLYLSDVQINTIVPYEVTSMVGQYVPVQVIYNGVPGNVAFKIVQATEPGIFSFDDGSGQGAILNQDSSINAANNPAPRGTVIQIFATGEGQTLPLGTDGAIANQPLAQIPRPVAAVSLTVGGVPVPPENITYAGTLPQGVAGAMQINAILPSDTPTGAAVPIVLTIGSNSSPNSLTVAVQ